MKYIFTTLVLTILAACKCTDDNCLRALRAIADPGHPGAAREFCATHTAGGAAPKATPPHALNACKDNAEIASACSCIGASSTSFAKARVGPAAYHSTTSASPTSSKTPTSTKTASLTSTSKPASATSAQACALVSSSSSAQRAANPAATPMVAAQLAHDCLNSVPLNKAAAIKLVDGIVPYIEWQSDAEFKKKPPADYFYPPHDIFAAMASVKTNLQADKYANEYEFQEDLYQVFAKAHDGHFVFYPDALTKAFEWGRKRALVSISEDGTTLPVIKIYEDVIASPSTASVVVKINGVEASKYVAEFAYTASFNQDADAAYNTMFAEIAFTATGTGTGHGFFSGGGRMRYIYSGPNTTFTFANGTTMVTENIAKVKGSFDAVTDGRSFYAKFCTVPVVNSISQTSEAAEGNSEARAAAANVITPGYPKPIIVTTDKVVSGHYLSGKGFEDVAVMSVLGFNPDDPAEFQSVVGDFFATAKRDGQTKLVIDLSANGGGLLLLGYDLFRQLFPKIVQEGNSRFRERDTFLAIAEIYSANTANFNPATASPETILQYTSSYNYLNDLNLTNKPFVSFEDKFTGNVIDGVKYTDLMRFNLDNPLNTINDTYGIGIDVTGYGSRKNFAQPFAAENIVMLFDGYCASTCTTFAEFMRTQGGVKSIAMGGRPQPGKIQGVGGVKGSQTRTYKGIYDDALAALKTASKAQAAILKRLTSYPIDRALDTGLNVRDNILPGNVKDGLPAQFVREEAECRLFYTQPMITDVTALWKAAAAAAFNGAKCAAGSLPKRSVEVENSERRSAVTPTVKKPTKKISTKNKSPAWFERHGRKAIV
ncbi:uncharacterized protein RSE6_13005 [Rhynchosporium secalis]|uniref:Uncharacterized protein n=1 Tax=Rhynchosporium secalis TaxID=38038 RepID=A0A1E1MSM7_RHYSE|nr:uncharacterized protein RSE6_13005 [Rhynchosporium secalis]